MKTFQEFMIECYSIQETSLNRVLSKPVSTTISAERGNKSNAENRRRDKRLNRRLKGAGFRGSTRVKGQYTENPGTSNERVSSETSRVITPPRKPKKGSKPKFSRKQKKKLDSLSTEQGLQHRRNVPQGSEQDDQDARLITKDQNARLRGTSRQSWPGKGKSVNVGRVTPGSGEFQTKVKNKTFTTKL